MGKAEEFIRDNTKALKEPNGREYFEWISPDQARKAVEIAREEVIEKGLKWLDDKFFDNHHCSGRGQYNEIICIDYDSMEELFEGFKKVLENEVV